MNSDRNSIFGLHTARKQFSMMFVAFTIFVLATVPVIAQDVAQDVAQQAAASNAPRQPGVRLLTSAWVGYAAMALIFGLIILISLRGSARGQQKP
jgi:hypothetical protein